MNELPEIPVTETNRYDTEKRLTFETTENEIMAFLGINFIMVINTLPGVEEYWSINKSI